MSLKPRSRRSGELRVRSGCRSCRHRRVKCPEQHPTCQHCQRLGLDCRYEILLSWDSALTRRRHARSAAPGTTNAILRSPNYNVAISDWMFLNLTVQDFGSHYRVRETPKPPPTKVTYAAIGVSFSKSNFAKRLAPPSLSMSWNPLSLSGPESRLLEYFIDFITPRCALIDNPYQDILLRLALTGGRGPLVDCIIAAAANQMQIIGHGESSESALRRRDRALSGLRKHVSAFEPMTCGTPGGTEVSELHPHPVVSSDDPRASDQLIWSAVMMCFFEISLDCPLSWKIHAEFASKLLLHQAARQPNGVVSESHQFAAAYLSLHYTLSCSASDSLPCEGVTNRIPQIKTEGADSFSSGLKALQYLPNDSLFRTLTGCPKNLVTLISEITELAQHPEIHQLEPTSHSKNNASLSMPLSPSTVMETLHLVSASRAVDGNDCSVYLQRRRDSIERGLHQLANKPTDGFHRNGDNTSDVSIDTGDDEMSRIFEAKRLAALMYLYSRIDFSDPYKPHMMRLTDQIIRLISGISTRTNTVLWPLFIVATLGVRPDCEDDRLLVLTKLSNLQQTRQLGNVRKARRVIEDVWKARDLRLADAFKGWDILHGKLDTISLA